MKRLVPSLMALTFVLAAASVAFAAAKPTLKPSDKPAAQPVPAAPSSSISTPGAVPLTTEPAKFDSLPILEKMVARDSSNFENLYRLGVAYLDHDQVPQAIQVLTRANKLRPKDVKTLVNLGAANDAGGRAADAQAFYRKALDTAPGDSVASCRLASSLYAQGQYDQSMKLLRDVIVKKPGSYCAYFTLGVAFADAGIYRDAIRMWKRVVELAPSSPEASSAKESIEVLEKFVTQ